MPELQLSAVPRHFKRTCRSVWLLKLFNESEQFSPRRRGDQREGDVLLLARFKRKTRAETEDGIQDRARRSLERFLQTVRIRETVHASQIRAAVGLIFKRALDAENDARDPYRGIVRCALSPVSDQSIAECFGLDEELRKHGVRNIRTVGRESQLHIRGDFDVSRSQRTVIDRQTAELRIAGRDGDLELRLHIMHAPHKRRAICGERDRSFADSAEGARCGRPGDPGTLVTKPYEAAPGIQCGVGSPSCDVETFPSAVTGAVVGDHQAVAAIRTELNMREPRLFRPYTILHLGNFRNNGRSGYLFSLHAGNRSAFEQQRFDRPDPWIRMKAA